MTKRGCGLVALAAALMVAAGGSGGDEAKIQGTWAWAAAEFNGRKAHPENYADFRRVFRGDQWANLQGGQPLERGTFRLDPSRSPRAIDLVYSDGQTYEGIYKLRGDTLEVCTALPGRGRPTKFASRAESGWGLSVYNRAKP